MYKQKYLGYSLIELLLVVAIVAALATVGISFYGKQSDDFKIDRATNQIQQILQAATAYYTDNSCWPSDTNCPISPSPNFNTYLPSGTNNPWGSQYTYQIAGNGNKFQVLVAAPNPNIANRIIAKLPNAALSTCEDGNKNCIIAETLSPGKPSTLNSNYMLKNINSAQVNLNGSSTSASFTTPTFSCLSGWIPQIVPIVRSIKPKDYDDMDPCKVLVHDLVVSQITVTNIVCSQTNVTNNYQCKFKLNLKARAKDADTLCTTFETRGLGNVTVAYLSVCCKPDSTGIKCAGPINNANVTGS